MAITKTVKFTDRVDSTVKLTDVVSKTVKLRDTVSKTVQFNFQTVDPNGFPWVSVGGEAFYDELVNQGWDEGADATALYSLSNDDIKQAIDDYFVAKEGIGATKFLVEYLHIGDTAAMQLINAANIGSFTGVAVNSPTFNNLGIVNNGTSYVTNGWIHTVNGSRYDTGCDVYCRTNDATGTVWDSVAQNSISQRFGIRLRGDTQRVQFYAHGGFLLASGLANIQGFFSGTRRASNDWEVYEDGGSLNSDTSDTGTDPSIALPYGARNDNGSITNTGSRNYCYYAVRQALTDAQHTTHNTAIQALQTTLGRNIT